MTYKRLISDKLALGYGSKCQLLRMLGWHRNLFNQAVSESSGIASDIDWLDFNFNGPEDKELLNFDFIAEIKDEWKAYWECGRFGLNWDAVGISRDGTYVLVEAKAHVEELNSSAGGSEKSRSKNNEVIGRVFHKYGIECGQDSWNSDVYQLINRLVALDFLLERGYKAKLVYVLFVNGYEFNRPNDGSASEEEWRSAMAAEFEKAGIANSPLEGLVNLVFIDCNPGKHR